MHGQTVLADLKTETDEEKWLHVAWTWSGLKKEIYLNGELDLEASVKNPDNYYGNLILGNRNNGLQVNGTPLMLVLKG